MSPGVYTPDLTDTSVKALLMCFMNDQNFLLQVVLPSSFGDMMILM